MEIESFIGFSTLLFFGFLIAGVVFFKSEPSKPNYKNISQMAKNLSVCKVGTRVQVIRELYENSEWTTEEVDELKAVLEGMLNTRLTIHKSGQNGLTARTTNDRG